MKIGIRKKKKMKVMHEASMVGERKVTKTLRLLEEGHRGGSGSHGECHGHSTSIDVAGAIDVGRLRLRTLGSVLDHSDRAVRRRS